MQKHAFLYSILFKKEDFQNRRTYKLKVCENRLKKNYHKMGFAYNKLEVRLL